MIYKTKTFASSIKKEPLSDAGAIDSVTMRKFDAMCLTPVHDFSAEQVKALRLKYQLSQSVFALYLNVSDKLIKKWEQGESKPRGPALKMLILVEKKGLDAIV